MDFVLPSLASYISAGPRGGPCSPKYGLIDPVVNPLVDPHTRFQPWPGAEWNTKTRSGEILFSAVGTRMSALSFKKDAEDVLTGQEGVSETTCNTNLAMV